MTSSLASRRLTTLGSAFLTALLLTCCKGHGATTSDAGSHDGGDAAASAGLPAPADVGAPPSDATRTASGVAYKVLVPGTGTDHPGKNDSANVNYTGWTTVLATSSTVRWRPLQPGRKTGPATMPLNRVIPGWSEAIQLMVVGEKGRFWIPEELAYKNCPGAPQGMLVFDIELPGLHAWSKASRQAAAAPPDAEKTQDGLASEVTQKGTGTVHPKPNDGVRVNYSIWQTDGRLLDASKDKPVVRPVSGFSDGWAEGVELMVVGEKRTLWVPASLSPPGRPGAPTPDVTMVLELLEILPGPKTPDDVKAPPKNAVVQKDGLASSVLTKGTGTAFPTPTSSVTVNYAGWTTDGKLFDSSYARGRAPSGHLGLGSVIPWLDRGATADGFALVAPDLGASRHSPTRARAGPKGMLVFDVELPRSYSAPPPPHGMPGGMGGMSNT